MAREYGAMEEVAAESKKGWQEWPGKPTDAHDRRESRSSHRHAPVANNSISDRSLIQVVPLLFLPALDHRRARRRVASRGDDEQPVSSAMADASPRPEMN